MIGLRVTKYNPAFRSQDGSYARSEWTSVSDVGRSYDGCTLTCIDYLRVESAYVETVHRFLKASRIQALRVVDLEVNDTCDLLPTSLAAEPKVWVSKISEGMLVGEAELDCVVRLALREVIWCRLEGPSGFYVHFGYDYYMYIGSESSELETPLLPSEIYAEPFESPYHKESSDASSQLETE